MRRLGIIGVGIAAIALVAAAAFALRPHRDVPAPDAAKPEAALSDAAKLEAAARKGAVPTLYCEFTNFADRTPLVGFYFTIEEGGPKPVYAQVFQREQDGTQDDFGGATAPRPEWSYDGSESPAVIHSPDDAMQINVYDYDPSKPGTNWFEAGLRSVRYRNLGGKCRHSTA
ncbi:hypothetical protein [Methylobacterium thuringiense]|uniref:Uncharacterized protein n=1 Tax=Methylobacterium thuringiense TaxID=1003091 RepID=A0ABQ4TLS7_9HYPH|nr:hypothetical protein [Methylobacterium thuringiense]GJE54975.1 hypothetical protein EKPJFOCH_1461 [Methylobacterium thuringiense]